MNLQEILTGIKTALISADLSFHIKGVVAFGSRIKETWTPDSDYDLLIVADGINSKRQRRGVETVKVKSILPLLPFDILLYTTDEAVSNFKNHNPLFLDITEDGVIIIDNNDFLKSLIEETREYIKRKKIKRLENGWDFSVERGVVAYLSKVSNKDFALAMFVDGERDYLIGKEIIVKGFYDKSVYHFQQSVEKFIKAVLIAMGIFKKTHFVGEVLLATLNDKEISEPWKEKLRLIAEISESIEPEVSLSRYPGIINDSLWLPSEEYEKEDADRAEDKAQGAMCTAKDFLKYWFAE